MRVDPDDDDRPCRPRRRGSCRHYDCMMARGEPLPDGVVGYINGVPYAPAGSGEPSSSSQGSASDGAETA